MRSEQHRVRTRARERGASLVEFALILPVFVVLIFGMITGGIAVSQQNSVKNAAREATRFAAVTQAGTTSAQIQAYLDTVIQQSEAAATGDLANTVSGKRICAAYTSNGSTFVSRTKTGGGTPVTGAAACFADGLGTSKARTQVLAERKSEIGAIFFTVPIDLSAKSVSRYEL